ncbi:MAG: hypothetical protein ACSLEY_04115 [Candidatus Saccharimonadales bacterium]
MKKQFLNSLQDLFKDKRLLGLSIVIIVIAIIYVLYVALSLGPTEQQIATRYSAFGDTHLYRNKWYYLLTFIVFAVVVAVSHIMLMLKLKERGIRSLGVGLGFLTIILLVILFFITRAVLGIAYLS